MTQQSHCWAYTPRKPELRDTCTPTFIATQFIIARTWKQPRCPSADDWIRKLWYIYIMEYSVWLSSVAQSCPTLCDPMDCSLPGFSILGIFQARVLEWVAIALSSILYWCFSFWLTSLCIIGSSFIHLIRTNSNVFFLMAG